MSMSSASWQAGPVKRVIDRTIVALASLLLAAVILLPLVWTMATSIKPRSETITYPPRLLPRNATAANYVRAFKPNVDTGQVAYIPMIFNSFMLGSAVTVATCVTSALAGYAIAARAFPGRKAAFYLILSAMLIPFQALLIPLFSEMNGLRLIDNLLSLFLIYVTFFQPLGVFIMKNTFSATPKELRESAQMAGCGEFQIFGRIYLPNALVGLVTVAVCTSAAAWNEFLIALIFMTSAKHYTLPVGLMFSFQPPFDIDWGMISAVSVITFIPTVSLFVALRRYFIRGVTAGALSAE